MASLDITFYMFLALTMPLLYKYAIPAVTRGRVKYLGKGFPTFLNLGLLIALFCPPMFWFLFVFIGEGFLGVVYELFLRDVQIPEFLASASMFLFYTLVAHLVFFLFTLLTTKVAPKVLSAEGLLDVWMASWLPTLYAVVLVVILICFRLNTLPHAISMQVM